MTRAGLIASLLAAAFVGAFLWGRFAVARERTRRVWRDWKKGRRAQRTLRKMLRRYAGQTATSAALVALAVALAIVVIFRRPS